MKTIINATLLTDGRRYENASVSYDNGIITDVDLSEKSKFTGEIIDARGNYLSYGMVDIHTHGNLDTDFNNLKDVKRLCSYYISNGTLAVMPTTMTASVDTLDALLTKLTPIVADNPLLMGVHMEGPFLSLKNAGAQSRENLAIVDEKALNMLNKHLDIVKRITFAPDVVGAEKLVDYCNAHNIRLSMGHDDSIDDEIDVAYNKGVRSVTHLYCCSSFVRRRDNNVKHLGLAEYAMSKHDIVGEIIADGHHIPDRLFDYIYSVKGEDGICLISDSIRTVDYGVHIEDNVAIIDGTNTYAGSVTPVFKMVEHIVENNNVPLETAVKMATFNPSRLAKLQGIGSVRKGYLARMIIFDKDFNILNTIFEK